MIARHRPIATLFPAAEVATETVDDTLDAVSGEPIDGRLTVADPRVVDFLVSLSKRLLRPEVARQHPELGSLGFFLRPAELTRARDQLMAVGTGVVRTPRGLVLHFPPANVDTIFVYSWAMSALAGNRNIVRISARSAVTASTVLTALNETLLGAHPAIGQTQRMISYARDDNVTMALSAACDLRVIWGGDDAVAAIRRHPIPPLGRDLAFPDRASFAVISLQGWADADEAAREAVAEGFANDLFWFDQGACSSPRDLCWVGASGAADARAEFDILLSRAVERKGWRIDAAMAVEKRVATYGLAATGEATRVQFTGNAIANVELRDLGAWQRRWLGAGTICHVTAGSLDELLPVIRRKDQTMTQFGFSVEELNRFARAVAERGIDRIVPIGQALTFARVWDGYDLLHEFSRLVTIRA